MKKYNEEYFSVINAKTGKKIADCGDEIDAIMLVSFDSQNRTYTSNKFLMSPVIDIEIPKQLPTSNIVVSNVNENGCSPRKKSLSDAGPLKLKQDNRVPINAK
jgi:hypothetical protein